MILRGSAIIFHIFGFGDVSFPFPTFRPFRLFAGFRLVIFGLPDQAAKELSTCR